VATFTKFNCFVEDLAEKVHNLGSDTLTVALTVSAPSASNTVLADISEISYTNCSTRDIITLSSAQSAGTYKLVCQDLVLSASGAVGPFRYVVLYNSTAAAGPLVGYYDYGSNVTMSAAQTFTIDFDGTNGVLTIL
jgi:hypothetical protein